MITWAYAWCTKGTGDFVGLGLFVAGIFDILLAFVLVPLPLLIVYS